MKPDLPDIPAAAPGSSPWVFGYGSLIYEPAFPDAILETRDATLSGHRRRLNQASPARGIPDHLGIAPALPGWMEGEQRLSLAFGTEPHPESRIDGVVVRYPEAMWPAVLDALQRREGCGPTWPLAARHYEQARVHVTIEGSPRETPALTFLSLPDGAQTRVLTDAEVVAVLTHATPAEVGEKRRGMHYVEGLGDERIAADPWLRQIVRALRR